jgi:hypothetical protein
MMRFTRYEGITPDHPLVGVYGSAHTETCPRGSLEPGAAPQTELLAVITRRANPGASGSNVGRPHVLSLRVRRMVVMRWVKARRRGVARFLVLALVPGGIAACKSDDGSSIPPGRGTAACHEWQRAYCDFATRCASADAAGCQDDASSITCKSDQAALDCAKKLDDVNCGAVTADDVACDLAGMADPAPAVKGCNDFVTATCKFAARCGTSDSDCRAQVATKVDCSKAIGIGLSVEQCLSELDKLSCSVSSAPESCKGIVKVGSGG